MPDYEHSFALPYNDAKSYYVYDIKIGNKLIEYNGDFWHANPAIYDETFFNKISKKSAIEIWGKEFHKEDVANSHGYQLYRIWESDYRKDPEGEVRKCINFLTT